MFVGVQPLGIQAQDGRLELALGHLEAGQVAIVAAQRGQRLGGRAVAQLHAGQARVQVLHQRLDREAVAGVQAQVRPAFGQQAFQFFLQLGGQALQRGHQPRIDAPVGPQQALGERRQRRAQAPARDQQRHAEQRLETAQHAPGVAV